MAIRAVVSLTKVDASVDHSALAASVTHTAAVMDDMTLAYVPKNRIVNDVCALDELTVVAYTKLLTEVLTPSDQFTIDATLGKTDNVTSTDTFLRTVEFNRALNESITTPDTPTKHLTKPMSDGAALADVVTRTHTFNRSFNDSFTLDDFASVDKAVVGNKTNVFGFTDVHSWQIAKEFSDSVGFLESVTVTRRSTAGFNAASFNTPLFN